jgi:uncharacterized protein YegJ (DUF2314 family)
VNALPRDSDKVPDLPIGQVTMTPILSNRLKMILAAAIIAALGGAILLMDAGAQERSQERTQERSPVVDVSSANAAMAAAIGKARATLPTFWASYEAPKSSETGHSLKARFANPKNDGEHIWMAEVKKLPGGRYSGRFANQPRDLPGKRAGDLVEFAEADISDWMFMRNGKIVGGETIRVLLKSLPKADADALRARLETP